MKEASDSQSDRDSATRNRLSPTVPEAHDRLFGVADQFAKRGDRAKAEETYEMLLRIAQHVKEEPSVKRRQEVDRWSERMKAEANEKLADIRKKGD